MLRHKGLLSLLSLLLAVLLVSAARADVDSHARIVRLSYAEGQVQIAHRDGIGYENATMNLPVVEGDQLRTSDGRAEIELEDGSIVRVVTDSQTTFAALGRYTDGVTITEVDLDQGEAEFKVTAHDDSSFRVNAAQRVITLRHSGRFRVTTLNSDPLEVVVWKGEVSVSDKDTTQEVRVKKEETFALDALDAGRYDLEKVAQADDLDQWSLRRDEYLSTYAANRASYAQSPYQYGLNDLNYYGQYVNVPGYGYCWQPYGINVGWDPYANGYWTYSPAYGYVWVSAYPWGWMPYRYGRWAFVSGYGWVWQPGYWHTWNPTPRIWNPPSGFRAPAPPPVPARTATSPAPPADAWPSRPAGRFSGTSAQRTVNTNDVQSPANAPVRMEGGPVRRTINQDDVQPAYSGRPASAERPAAGSGATGSTNTAAPVREDPRVPERDDAPAMKHERPVETFHPAPPAQRATPRPTVAPPPPATMRTDRPAETFHASPPVQQPHVAPPPPAPAQVSHPAPPPTPPPAAAPPARTFTPPPAPPSPPPAATHVDRDDSHTRPKLR